LEAGFGVVFVELPSLIRSTIRPPPEWFAPCRADDGTGEEEENETENSGVAAPAAAPLNWWIAVLSSLLTLVLLVASSCLFLRWRASRQTRSYHTVSASHDGERLAAASAATDRDRAAALELQPVSGDESSPDPAALSDPASSGNTPPEVVQLHAVIRTQVE
jgi:hypothetical protein